MFIVKRQINYLQLRRSDMYLTLGLSSLCIETLWRWNMANIYTQI